jgi:hypothetical protein
MTKSDNNKKRKNQAEKNVKRKIKIYQRKFNDNYDNLTPKKKKKY